MKRIPLPIFALFLFLVLCATRAFADSPSLQDMSFYVNGTTLSAGSDPTFQADAAALGINLSGFSLSTGLGTITYTTTLAGAGNFNAWFDEELGVPFYNEYGSTVGTAASGTSWEIGDSYLSNIFNDAAAGSLTNTNTLPEGASNYLGTCTGACNGDVSGALGQAYLLASGYKEIISITISQSAPGSGFYLDLTHPVDDNNPSTSDAYYSETSTQVPNSGPSPVPEPGTLMLVLTGLGAAAVRLRHRIPRRKAMAGLGVLLLVLLAVSASAQVVKTVPWDPTNAAAPHTAYPGASIVLGATFDPGSLASHSFTYAWNFGDGTSATAATAIANFNDISGSHTYAGTTVGQTWTAVVTVTDTGTHQQYTGNYLVIWENNTLQSRVNVAIDKGLWFLHATMYHPSAGKGTWSAGCASGYPGYACGSGWGSLDANNVQAFEVNGHQATGPATDPYTSDVQEGLDDMFTYMNTMAVGSKTYNFNTATANYRCPDGTPGAFGQPPATACAPNSPVYFNPGGIDCSAGCAYTFDGNNNGRMIQAGAGGSWYYEQGMYADAIVASQNPNGVANTGPVAGMKYKDIVQDVVDAAGYCQYGYDYDNAQGYTRGSNSYQGGGWWYNCQTGDDNSVSQWAAIGLIGAQRGFGLSIPKIVTDANNMWVTASQDAVSPLGVAGAPGSYTTDERGGFGYNGALQYSDPWTPFATTPSGMVQMAMDGIGRTKNVAFGDATTDPDQRWNNSETYYADNFCNEVVPGYGLGSNPPYYFSNYSGYVPKSYTYGLFSFTKSMLLHSPGGVLTPIKYLRTQTPGVFNNPGNPANTIDWYAALSAANGGHDPCDGVAQSIVARQITPTSSYWGFSGANAGNAGFWYYDNANGGQYPYETAWSLIMLQRTVFVNCVNNLGGKGTASSLTNPARVDLTWTGIPNVTGYDVLRSTTNGGPYAKVGSTTTTAYSDRTGLSNNMTYYYVLQPTNNATAVCQSNQATIAIPKPR